MVNFKQETTSFMASNTLSELNVMSVVNDNNEQLTIDKFLELAEDFSYSLYKPKTIPDKSLVILFYNGTEMYRDGLHWKVKYPRQFTYSTQRIKSISQDNNVSEST